jgi:hypothetical protein
VAGALRQLGCVALVAELTFLTTQFGKPFTSNGFGSWDDWQVQREGKNANIEWLT